MKRGRTGTNGLPPVVANGAAYFAWFRIVRLLPAGISGISALAIPCVGVASSAWLTGERLHPQDLVAMALIGLALLCVLAERYWFALVPVPRDPDSAAANSPAPPLPRG